MQYLNKKLIISFNRATVKEHGGNFIEPHNFLHEENLDYLLDAVSAEMFGSPLYPSISDKAAVYCYNIICNHIFSDGNKRTGLAAALLFLNLNNYELNPIINDEILTTFILSIASGQINLEECRAWFQENIVVMMY
jgi:death on curing protein